MGTDANETSNNACYFQHLNKHYLKVWSRLDDAIAPKNMDSRTAAKNDSAQFRFYTPAFTH